MHKKSQNNSANGGFDGSLEIALDRGLDVTLEGAP